MSTKPTLLDDSRAAAVQAAIDRDSVLLLNELSRLLDALPGELAPLIAAEPDLAKRRAILDCGIQRVREKIETAMQAMVDKFGESEH